MTFEESCEAYNTARTNLEATEHRLQEFNIVYTELLSARNEASSRLAGAEKTLLSIAAEMPVL